MQVINSFLSTLGRILAYIFIAIVVLLLFNKCDVKAEMLPDFDKMTLNETRYCTNLTGSDDITISCYSANYSTKGVVDKENINGECIKADIPYVSNRNFKTISNEKVTYFTFNIEDIKPKEIAPNINGIYVDRVYPGNWYAVDFYVTTFDETTTFKIPTNENQKYGGFTTYHYDSPYTVNSKGFYPSPIDTVIRNVYKAENIAYTHLFYLFRLPDPPASKTELASWITVPVATTNTRVTDVDLLGYRIQYVGDTGDALNFITDNSDYRQTDDETFIYFDSCSGENPTTPDTPMSPGLEEEKTGIEKFIDSILDGLKSLVVPKNLDFIYDFTDALENKLGFIGTVPAKIIKFGIELVNSVWKDKITFKLPRIKIMGYYFWPDAEINVNEGFNWVSGIKYMTNIACVCFCIIGLQRYHDKFF